MSTGPIIDQLSLGRIISRKSNKLLLIWPQRNFRFSSYSMRCHQCFSSTVYLVYAWPSFVPLQHAPALWLTQCTMCWRDTGWVPSTPHQHLHPSSSIFYFAISHFPLPSLCFSLSHIFPLPCALSVFHSRGLSPSFSLIQSPHWALTLNG